MIFYFNLNSIKINRIIFIKKMERLICYKLINKTDFYFNVKVRKHLDNIIESVKKSENYNEIPNMLLIGLSGSGRHSIMKYFVFNLFNCQNIDNNDIFYYELMEFKNKTTSYYLKYTNYFLMIDNISLANDKTALQDLIKKYTSQKTIDNQIKFIIINDIDKLSYFSQMSLRRTMEIYNNECKFILIGERKENILKPLISRCINFRIAKPSNEELNDFLEYLITKNSLDLTIEQQKTIIENSDNNISEFFTNLNKEVYNDLIKVPNTKESLYNEIFSILNDKYECEILSYGFIKNKVLDLIKYGEDVQTIIRKINNNVYSNLDNEEKIKKLNDLNKKMIFKYNKTEQEYMMVNIYLSELLFILV